MKCGGGGGEGFCHLMFADMSAQPPAKESSLAMESRPFKAATAPPVARLPCHVSHCVSQHGLDAFGTLFKDFGRRPSCEEPPSSMHAAFIGIFLTRPRFPDFSCVKASAIIGYSSSSAQEGQIEGLLRACVQSSERRERHGLFWTRTQRHQHKL